MSIEVKHYKKRDKRKKQGPRPEADKPPVWGEGTRYYYMGKGDITIGPFKTWGEAEVSRRAYWKEA